MENPNVKWGVEEHGLKQMPKALRDFIMNDLAENEHGLHHAELDDGTRVVLFVDTRAVIDGDSLPRLGNLPICRCGAQQWRLFEDALEDNYLRDTPDGLVASPGSTEGFGHNRILVCGATGCGLEYTLPEWLPDWEWE